MKTGPALAALLIAVWVRPAGSTPAHAQGTVISRQGTGAYFPRAPITVKRRPWRLSWTIDCWHSAEKYAVIHVDWGTFISARKNQSVVADLVRVEATGQRPTRYTGFRDPVGSSRHFLHAYGDSGTRIEHLPAGKYLIKLYTSCRWRYSVSAG
jgi:hypothetical protein